GVAIDANPLVLGGVRSQAEEKGLAISKVLTRLDRVEPLRPGSRAVSTENLWHHRLLGRIGMRILYNGLTSLFSVLMIMMMGSFSPHSEKKVCSEFPRGVYTIHSGLADC